MTAQHTMTPGRIVHYRQSGAHNCIPAVLEHGHPDGDGYMAGLVRISNGLGDGHGTLNVPRDRGAHVGTWHWTDECPMQYPETD